MSAPAFTPWTASIEKRPAPAPGHWYVVLDEDENGLGEFYGDDHDANVANLRLAAAAPELYEALEQCLAVIADMSRFVGQMSLRDYAAFNDAPIAAERALAKARGEA